MDAVEPTTWEEELLSFSVPVLEEYRRVLPTVRGKLGEVQLADWVLSGARLGQAAFRAWPVAVEYFRASALLLETLPFDRVGPWVSQGETLALTSADLAVAYFRASPWTLPGFSREQVSDWTRCCARLYNGGWQSSALAVKLFDGSPRLLEILSLNELDLLGDVLEHLGALSYPLALGCLDAALETLPRLHPGEQAGVILAAQALAARNPRYVRDWWTEAPGLLRPLTPSCRSGFLRLARSIATGYPDPQAALGALRGGSAALAELNPVAQRLALSHAQRLAETAPEAAAALLLSAGRLLDRLDLEELDRWVADGLEVLLEQPGAGVAFFRLESGQSHAALRRHSRGVELTQVGDLLRLYCKALSGKDVLILPAEELTRKGMGWTAEGQPTTEGDAIYLPSLLQSYPSQLENFDCMKVCATHQSAHLEFGSFDFRFDRPAHLFTNRRQDAESRASRRERPLTDIERFFDLFDERRMVMDVFTVLEDARLDGRIAREYPGIRTTLRRVQRDSASERPSPRSMPLRTAVLEALLLRSLDPDAALELPRRAHEAFSAAWAYVARLQTEDAAVEDTAEAVLRVYALLQGLGTGAIVVHEWAPVEAPSAADLASVEEDGWSLHSSGGQSVGSEFTGNQQDDAEAYAPLPEVPYRGDFKPQLVQTLMKLKEINGQADPSFAPASAADLKGLLDKLGETELSELLIDDSDVSTGLFATNLLREAEGTPGEGMARSQKRALTGDVMRAGAAREYTYDEWDFRASGYRHQWCLLRERVLECGEPAYFDETLRKHRRMAREVQRQFQMLKPELFRKIKNLPEGEEYDLDALVEAQVDRRAGVASSEKLYWRRNKEERSVAVAFLLDVSASTDEDVVKDREVEDPWKDWDDDPRNYMVFLRERMQHREQLKKQRRRIIDVEKESTVLLIHALETLGDAYGVYGFSGYGRDNVEVFVVKDLEEPFGETVKGRLEGLEPVRGTRMGAAIRHAITKLDAWDARLKILLLLSDGRPQDHDYGRDRTEKEYALQDTRKALLEARQKQIVPFALTVDREGHDYLKTICEGIGYEVVDDIESLPARLPALYRQLTS